MWNSHALIVPSLCAAVRISMTPAGYQRVSPPAAQPQSGSADGDNSTMLLVRLTSGAKGAAADRALVRTAGSYTEIVRPFQPPPLTNLRRAGDAPVFLAGFLLLLGTVALVHALFVAIRAGRRDLAVLRALGFANRQLRALLAWQASGGILVGVAVGLPTGIVVGRLAWTLVADRMGLLARPVVDASLVALVVASSVVVGNSVALTASRRVVRIRPSEVLRSE